jgi:hypothetical protein
MNPRYFLVAAQEPRAACGCYAATKLYRVSWTGLFGRPTISALTRAGVSNKALTEGSSDIVEVDSLLFNGVTAELLTIVEKE